MRISRLLRDYLPFWGRAIGFVAALTAGAASAGAMPIVYTGELTAENGLPYTGAVEVSAALYSGASGGSALWTQAPMMTTVEGGVLQLGLEGSGLDALLASQSTLWLEFSIDGETLSPRQQVARVPYAAVAGTAQWLGGRPAADYVTIDGALSPQALPTNAIGQVSNGALNNQFNAVTYSWSGSSSIGDNPDPGGQAIVTSAETGQSYLTSLTIQTSYTLQFANQIQLTLYPPPASGLGPIVLETALKTSGPHPQTWTPGNTPQLGELLGKKVEGQWTILVTDLDDNAAPGVVVGSLTAFSVQYDVVRSDHLQVAGRLEVQGNLDVAGTGTFGGAIQAPGLVIKTQAYTNDTAYVTTTSWETGPTFSFTKIRANSDLLLTGAMPFYIEVGNSGYGFRVQYRINGGSWLDAGLPNGPADGWGAGGYGGNTSGITPVLEYISNQNVAGQVDFRIQIRKWAAADSAYVISYPGYQKRARWVVQEIAR